MSDTHDVWKTDNDKSKNKNDDTIQSNTMQNSKVSSWDDLIDVYEESRKKTEVIVVPNNTPETTPKNTPPKLLKNDKQNIAKTTLMQPNLKKNKNNPKNNKPIINTKNDDNDYYFENYDEYDDEYDDDHDY
jgi:hypothetical protein